MAKKKPATKTPAKTKPKTRRQPAAKQPDPLAHITEQLRPLTQPLDALQLNPKNAVKHDQASITAIAASLKAYGQVKPIVVNEADNIVLAGNGTYQAAASLGWTQIAVVFVQHDAATATGYAIADNRTAEFALWDDELLAELLAEVHNSDADLFAALELSELCDVAGDGLLDDAGGTTTNVSIDVPETWIVAVECDGEAAQKELYDRLVGEGYKVKVQML